MAEPLLEALRWRCRVHLRQGHLSPQMGPEGGKPPRIGDDTASSTSGACAQAALQALNARPLLILSRLPITA